MSDTEMIRGFVKNILKPIIAEAIAEVKGIPTEHLIRQTAENAKALFSI